MIKIKALPTIAALLALAATNTVMSAPELRQTRATLKEWVELKLISEERSSWTVEQQTLNESIDLLTQEIEKLDEQITAMQEDADAAQLERQSLNNEEDELKRASAVVQQVATDLEAAVLDLMEYFPQSLQDKLSFNRTYAEKRQEADALGLSTRIQYVIGILGEIEKFHNQITVEETMQRIGDSEVAVKTCISAWRSPTTSMALGPKPVYYGPLRAAGKKKIATIWQSKSLKPSASTNAKRRRNS